MRVRTERAMWGLLAVAGLLLLAAAPAVAKPVAWVLPSLARVAPDEPAGSGRTAALAAARGETESFQVVVRAEAEPAAEVTIGVSDLKGPNGAVLGAREHRLYRQHFVEVRHSAGGRPGWYPDALVPFRDPLTGRAPARATIKAQPVTVEAGRVQPFWVDVTVPADTPPGLYKGTWWAKGAHGRIGGGPVELTVWRATLPAAPGLRSSFNQWNDHSLAADMVLVRHKVMPLWLDPAGARKLAGAGALNAAGLGFWSGAEDGSCTMSGPPGEAQLAQRAAAFPEELLLYNLTARNVAGCTELAAPLAAWAEALHAAGVRNLVVGSPEHRLGEDGRPVVDIWAVGPTAYHRAPERVREARAGGAELWATTALAGDGSTPAWLLDRPPLGYRLLPGFLGQSLGFTGLLYWAVDYWSQDAWTDVTYRSADGQAWPGEGMLVYPGGPAGIGGVAPSLRLKWIRDGVEDYDLIALARARGIAGLEQEIEAVAGRDWRGATTDPAVLEAARRRLGAALDGP